MHNSQHLTTIVNLYDHGSSIDGCKAVKLQFHLLVMLHSRGVSVAQVMAELQRRQGQSGLAEKAARPK